MTRFKTIQRVMVELEVQSGEQGKMEKKKKKTDREIICGAQTTLAVKR